MAKTEVATIREIGGSTANRPAPDEIALRAYEIFLERGATPGNDLDDWLQAEEELVKKQTNAMPMRAPVQSRPIR
jgi:Protein of unknown function (DUF2934)